MTIFFLNSEVKTLIPYNDRIFLNAYKCLYHSYSTGVHCFCFRNFERFVCKRRTSGFIHWIDSDNNFGLFAFIAYLGDMMINGYFTIMSFMAGTNGPEK
jgi:hypothetical protein